MFRSNDDGEPTNSDGKPILGQIKSMNLTNILVVVLRYFGGTKLGLPDLIRAYKTSTKTALLKASIIKEFEWINLKVHFDYSQMNEVMRFIKDYNLIVNYQNFNLNCTLQLQMKKKQKSKDTQTTR